MCIRLYPDIIVAATVMNKYSFAKWNSGDQTKIEEIQFKVKDCIETQKRCGSMGIDDLFLPNVDDGNVYDFFITKKCDKFITSEGDEVYNVNLVKLTEQSEEGEITKEAVVKALRSKVLVEGIYTENILKGMFLGLE